jgi:hypothetical protein
MARPQCHTPLVSVASNFHFMRFTSANSKLLFNPHQHGTKATPIFRSQLDVNYTQNYIHPKGWWFQTILTCPKFFVDDMIFCMWSNYGNLVANALWKFTCRLSCSNVSIISISSHSKFNFGKLDSSYPRIADVIVHKPLWLELWYGICKP